MSFMATGNQFAENTYEFGPFRLIPTEHRIYRLDEQVLLPPKEFDLLLLLVKNQGQVMPREALIKALWPNTVVEEANLNVHISALRKILAEGQVDQHYIETLPRLGYRFIAPVTAHPEIEPQPTAEIILPAREPAAGQAITGQKNRYPWARLSLPLWLIAIGLFGLAGIWLFKEKLWSTTNPSNNTAPNIIPLTSYPGQEMQAAFSPDGNQIAFVCRGDKESNTDIYVRLVEGGNRVQITHHAGDNVNPVWSPDGRTLAFYRSTSDGDGIFLTTALGGSERKLISVWANRFSFGIHTWLHWSPDGKWLVISDKESATEPFGLFLVSPETGENHRLTTSPNSTIGDCSPAFSPDGKTIAFVRVVSAVVGELQLIPVQGGAPKQITFDGAGASNLTWTKNGQEIVFSSRYGGKSRLYKIDVTGGKPEWLVASGNNAQYPSYSSSGNRLAWTQNSDNSDIYRLSLNEGRAIGSPAALATSTTMETSPRYAPDGKRIAFVSNRSGNDEIWLADGEGENPIRLTSFRGPLGGSPTWSPDGKFLAFDARPDGNADLFIISCEGGQPRRLTTDAAEDIVPAWSGDGQWIYFSSNRSGSLQLWKTSVDGKQTVQVTKDGGFDPFASPDGQWIYFTKDRGSAAIWRIPVKGGTETLVLDFQQKNYSRMWTVTDDGIYFVIPDAQGRTLINHFDFATQTTKPVAQLNELLRKGVSGLSVSVDKKFLLLPLIAQRSSDLMMIENYR